MSSKPDKKRAANRKTDKNGKPGTGADQKKAVIYKYVILGGGVAAGYAARQFVTEGISGGKVALISKEPVPPYERPALSKAYIHPPGAQRARLPGFFTCAGDGTEAQDKDWYKKNGIHLMLKTTAVKVDTEKKRITVKDSKGHKRIGYKYLVIATGCRAVSAVEGGLPGGKLKGIFTLRDEKDAARIVRDMERLVDPNRRKPKSKRDTEGTVKSRDEGKPLFRKAKLHEDLLESEKPVTVARQTRVGHSQSAGLMVRNDFEILAQKRNAIYTKLYQFYTKHDPSKLTLYENMATMISFVNEFGHEALNENLVAKYGEGIDRPEIVASKWTQIDDPMLERNEIYAKLYYFYKTFNEDKIPELEVATEVIMNMGIDQFNEKAKVAYGVELDEALMGDIKEINSRASLRKTQRVSDQPMASVRITTDVNDNDKLEVETVQILLKLAVFYLKHEKSILKDLDAISDYTAEYGVGLFNGDLENKYGDTLDPYFDNGITPAMVDSSNDEDFKKEQTIKALIRFYQANEKTRLGRLQDMVAFVMYNGIQAFNAKLKIKYKDTIKEEPGDKIKEKDYIHTRLTRFYQKHEQANLNRLEDIVTYIIFNGVTSFNELLVEKYGENLGQSGSSDDIFDRISVNESLTKFYAKYDPSKLKNVENLVQYAQRTSIDDLNKKLMVKYNHSLKDADDMDMSDVMLAQEVERTNRKKMERGTRRAKKDKNRKPHVVIVGGGYIGIETASAFAGWGVDITLVIARKLAMSKLFTKKMAGWFERYFEQNHSINLIKEAKVTKFYGSDRVTGLKLSNGDKLNCDMVILGIGGKANIELFKNQLEMLDPTTDVGGILVNQYLQTYSKPEIFCIGDVAAFPHGNTVSRLEHVDNARKSAQLAVKNIVREKNTPYIYFPYFYSRMFEYTDDPVGFRFYGERGTAEDRVEIVHFGDFNATTTAMFGAFWVDYKTDEVIGGLLCNPIKASFYQKLHDIVLSAPKLVDRTEENAQALFQEELIAELI